MKNIFIRGSVLRYVHLKKDYINTNLLEDSARLDHKQANEVQ